MMETAYKYMFIDAQWLLVRHWSRVKTMHPIQQIVTDRNGNPVTDELGALTYISNPNMTYQEIVKLFFWSLGKLFREEVNAEKLILLWDCPPYHKVDILGSYKSNRIHITKDDLDAVDQDKDPVTYRKLEIELEIDSIKNQAKRFIITNFDKLGIPSIIYPGYEGDDLAYLVSWYLNGDDEQSLLHSVDSDWEYWMSPNTELLRFNRGYFNYYDKFELESTWYPEKFNGWTLFDYKKYWDSFVGSHNDLHPVIKSNLSPEQYTYYYKNIYNKSFSEDGLDKELAIRQLKSFDIYDYPNIEEVIDLIDYTINYGGSIGTVEDKHRIFDDNDIGVSDKKYLELISNFNPYRYAD